MKTMKNDIRYIIKRILIGVGIVLILGFLGKKGVSADSPTNYYLIRQTDSIHSDLIYTSMPSDYSTYLDFSLPYNNNINLNIIDSTYNLSNSSSYYIIFYNETLNVYYYFTIIDTGAFNNFDLSKMKIQYDSTNDNYLYYFYNNNDDEYQYISGLNRSFFISNGLVDLSNYTSSPELNSYNFTSDYYIYNNSPLTNLGSGYLLYAGLNENLLNDFTIYDTNLSSLYINGVEQDLPVAPSYFQEVDITNYQAIYFIPKDYVEVPSFIKDGEEFLHFNYYLNGSVNSGYFNIENTNDDFTFNSDENLVSFANFEYIESSFPLYYKNDDLSAFMLFNTGNETKIMYDTRYYNYYLVKDISDYAEEVQFIDENGEEVSRYISFTTVLEDYWVKGFQSGGDNFNDNSCSNGGICADNIISYIDFLKLPFTFLRSLSKNNCSPINITIPFVGGTIQINCLSSIFSNILGNFYNILLYIITGLYAYRITIMNIDTITDVLNPSDDKLEVVDL